MPFLGVPTGIARREFGNRWSAGFAAFCTEGEACDLPLPVGRPVATGALRLQATTRKLPGQDLPDSIRRGQRLTGMTAHQTHFPTAPSIYKFAQHGNSGATLSELLPHTAKIADDLCFIKSMNTEQINHDPAITFALTGFQLAGRPSLGSWVGYGLGSENKDLPGFVVMVYSAPPATSRSMTVCGAAVFCHRVIRA